MEGPFTILGVSLSGYTVLYPLIEKYQKDKEIKDELVNALGEDIRNYKNTFDDLHQIGEDVLMPSLEAFKAEGGSSKDKVNSVIFSVTEMYTAYGKIIDQFVKLAEDCKGIALNSAFMSDLMKYNSFLHDYVSQMGRMATGKNTVKIDKDFYTFVRMHENKVFLKIKDKEVDDATEKVKAYVKIVNNQIKPFISTSTISRVNLKRFIDSWKGLTKDAKRIIISKELLNNLKEYMPSKLAPVAVLYEEVFPKKAVDKLRFKGNKKDRQPRLYR
jgi:hypothetical protein